MFWTSSTSLRVVRKEGEDFLLPCLLTDPEAKDLGLRMDNGTTVPPEMNYTVYRHRGILIHSLQPSFNADYVCTAKVKGVEKTSKAFSINVIQSGFTVLNNQALFLFFVFFGWNSFIFISFQSSVSLLMSFWRWMNMCVLLGRNSRFDA